jgi:hypothetical protein
MMGKRQKKLANEIATFVRQYRRKSDNPLYDPNDRRYDRE